MSRILLSPSSRRCVCSPPWQLLNRRGCAAQAARAWPSSSRLPQRQPWQPASPRGEPSPREPSHTPWFNRLVRRIDRAEASLGFDNLAYASSSDASAVGSPNAADAAGEDAAVLASKLFRLYKQAGRPGREQRPPSEWAPGRLAVRAERLWEFLRRDVWRGAASPPLSTRLERLEAVGVLSRPGAADGIHAAIEELAAIVGEVASGEPPPGDAEREHIAVAHATLASAASWCLAPEQGRGVLNLARDRAGVDVTQSSFLMQVAALLGEASVDFEVVLALSAHVGAPATPQVLVAWLQALGNTVHGQGTFQLAERAVVAASSSLPPPPSASSTSPPSHAALNSDADVRNALITVAMTDRSTGAIDGAFELLSLIQRDRQALAVATCNAMAMWCVNWPSRPRRQSFDGAARDRFSEVHERITVLEDAMLACEVRPTPALLANILCAYSNAGDAIRVFSVLQNMKTREMPVDRRIYLEVVRALGQASVPTPAARELLADPSRVLNGLLRDMHSSGVAADVNFLNGALRVYVGALDNFRTLNRSASAFGKHPADRLHLASLAWDLFTTATEGSHLHGAITPNNVTYNLLIRIFCGANEFERYVRLRLGGMGWQPFVERVRALIRVCNY